MGRNCVESLERRLESVIEGEGGAGWLGKYSECVLVLQEGVEEMRKLIESNPFTEKGQEIQYFKYDAPRMYGRLFLYMKLVKIEGCREYYSRKKFGRLLEDSLKEADAYLEQHSAMCEYYYHDRTFWDDFLFTRRSKGEWSGEEIGAFIGDDFTIGAYLVSWIKAYVQLRHWILSERGNTAVTAAGVGDVAEGISRKKGKGLVWTASNADLVELGQSLHLAKCFNHGKATEKDVMEGLAIPWGVNLPNYHVTKAENAIRKYSRTKLLDRMKEELVKKMDEAL